MSAQRTPGAWQIASYFERGCGISNGIQGVATAYGINNDEAKANARLIAAAPELLGIVQTIAKLIDEGVPVSMILDENSPTLDAIRDVLAKVLGSEA